MLDIIDRRRTECDTEFLVRLTARGSDTIQVSRTDKFASVSRLGQVLFLKAAHEWMTTQVYKQLKFANKEFQDMAQGPLPIALYSDAKNELLTRIPRLLGGMHAYTAQELLDVANEASMFLAPSAPVLSRMTPALAKWFAGDTGPSESPKGNTYTIRKGGEGSHGIISFRKLEPLLMQEPDARRVIVSATLKWLAHNDAKLKTHSIDHHQYVALEYGMSQEAWRLQASTYLFMLFMMEQVIPSLPQSLALTVIAQLAEFVVARKR